MRHRTLNFKILMVKEKGIFGDLANLNVIYECNR